MIVINGAEYFASNIGIGNGRESPQATVTATPVRSVRAQDAVPRNGLVGHTDLRSRRWFAGPMLSLSLEIMYSLWVEQHVFSFMTADRE